jgi:hypothetical protein
VKIKLIPIFDFNKYDCGLAIAFYRENESKKYIRKYKTINYIFGISLLCFSIGFILEINGRKQYYD